MYASAYVLGFHGCDRELGESILHGERGLQPSKNDYDWLGHGIYFWENDPKRAFQWAKFLQERFPKKVRNPFVVGAIIDLGRSLDLTDADSLEEVRLAYQTLRDSLKKAGQSLPENKPARKGDEDLILRNLDCAVINMAHDLREEKELPAFDSVRSPFFEGRPLYEGARIMEKTHVQICLRRAEGILGYFRVKG